MNTDVQLRGRKLTVGTAVLKLKRLPLTPSNRIKSAYRTSGGYVQTIVGNDDYEQVSIFNPTTGEVIDPGKPTRIKLLGQAKTTCYTHRARLTEEYCA